MSTNLKIYYMIEKDSFLKKQIAIAKDILIKKGWIA